jgi:hypothetical protein
MWNKPKELLYGFAALGGLIIPFALVIPSMHQVWYVGPIAKVTGDLGFEFTFMSHDEASTSFRSHLYLEPHSRDVGCINRIKRLSIGINNWILTEDLSTIK